MRRDKFVSQPHQERKWCPHDSCERLAHADNIKGECWDPRWHNRHKLMFIERAKKRLKEDQLQSSLNLFRLINYAQQLGEINNEKR